MCNILESLIMELKVIQFNSHQKQTTNKWSFEQEALHQTKYLKQQEAPKYTPDPNIIKNISVNWIKAGIK